MIGISDGAHMRQRSPVIVPEDDPVFRLAQLVILLHVAAQYHPDGVELERLGAYDFLAANPLLMASSDEDPDRLELLMAGFDDRALSYASPSQRFATRRERLQHDLALLLAYGLGATTVRGYVLYRLTDFGNDMASQFTAIYAGSYATAANIVVKRLRKASGKKLREHIAKWTLLSARSTRFDLADLFVEPIDNEATDVSVVNGREFRS